MPCFPRVPETGTSPLNIAASSKTDRSTGDLRWWPQTTCGGCLGHLHRLPSRAPTCQVPFPSARAGGSNPGITRVPGQDLPCGWTCAIKYVRTVSDRACRGTTRPSPTEGDRAPGRHLPTGRWHPCRRTARQPLAADPRRDTRAQPDRREPSPRALGKQRQGQCGDRLYVGGRGVRQPSRAGSWTRVLLCWGGGGGFLGGKARCLTLREKRPSAECWTRGGETQSVFPSFAISSSQILVSSSISWFWKKSRP